ncbi:hypothetical protein [Psychroserpens jangbogonensis]|uniref:hypothetical protein n=1 Tax=Psychroserpens jangbogonensis TaxID=1484460 RepID=UPI00053EBD0D|nr:hypothetical protein [Psychroserpens jangbogonensis]
MEIIETINKKHKSINQDIFFMLLKNQKIEEAIEKFMDEDIEIEYNSKQRFISKKIWIKYLKKTILNTSTEVVQFKVEETINPEEKFKFRIFMICKKLKGTFDLTEIRVCNIWKNNQINKMEYKLINH